MPTRTENEFTCPQAIFCEGPDDVSFFTALINERYLPAYNIRHTGKTRDDRGGYTRFGERIAACQADRSFRKVVKKVLVVVDSDGDAASRFAEIQNQLRIAGVAVPAAERAEAVGTPTIAVWVTHENLECTCIDAAKVASINSYTFVDQFVNAVTSIDWATDKKGKLWLRASLSSRWMRDPFVGLGQVFQGQESRRMIPLEHASFNDIANYLQNFALN